MPRNRKRKVSSLTPTERKMWAQSMLARVALENPNKLTEAVRLAEMAGLSASLIAEVTGKTLWEITEMLNTR